MKQVVKVFTPVKRVPTMIGKAQNGQKLPFGPYTLPQVGVGAVLLALTGIVSLTVPGNPAVPFVSGVAVTVLAVFSVGLVPYTGVRMSSRALWIGRLLVRRRPVSASGMPVVAETRIIRFVEESVAIVIPASPARAVTGVS